MTDELDGKITYENFVSVRQRRIMIAVCWLIRTGYGSLLVAADISSSQDAKAARQLGVTIDLNYQFTGRVSIKRLVKKA